MSDEKIVHLQAIRCANECGLMLQDHTDECESVAYTPILWFTDAKGDFKNVPVLAKYMRLTHLRFQFTHREKLERNSKHFFSVRNEWLFQY